MSSPQSEADEHDQLEPKGDNHGSQRPKRSTDTAHRAERSAGEAEAAGKPGAAGCSGDLRQGAAEGRPDLRLPSNWPETHPARTGALDYAEQPIKERTS